MTRILLAGAAVVALLVGSEGARADTIFNDFSASPTLYESGDNGYVIDGSNPGPAQTLAAQFTVGGSGTYSGAEIVLGLADISGTNSYSVSLWTNTVFSAPAAAGAGPDTELGSWNVTTVPAYDSSGNETVAVSIAGTDLTAGEALWLVVAPGADDTSGLWGFTSTAESGLTENVNGAPNAEAYDASDINVLPAFSVSGSPLSPVPEPASMSLLGSGLIALGALRRRKRKPA